MQRKIKVLLIVNNLGVGGIEKLVYDLVSHATPGQFSLEICCAREKKGEWVSPLEEKGIQIHFLGNYRKDPVRFFIAYKRLLKEKSYQAVHVHLNHFSGLFLFLPARLSIPVRIAHYHNDFHRQNKLFWKKLIFRFFRMVTDRYATVSVGISDTCLDSVYGDYWREKTNVRRIYNGVDLDKFKFCQSDRSEIRSSFGIDPDSIVIGHVGRFRPQKNHIFIVELAVELCRHFKKVVFFLVGDGLLFNEIKKSVKEKGLEDYFVFAGARTDVPALMSSMDIFILPSLWEGFGLTVIEAQASGLPVLASNSLPEEIPMINNSKRLPLDDLVAWIEACELLIENKCVRRKGPDNDLAELCGFSIGSWISNVLFLYERR